MRIEAFSHYLSHSPEWKSKAPPKQKKLERGTLQSIRTAKNPV